MRDLESAPALASEGASPLRDALDYSRSLNETFRRGAPGRILSRDRQGGQPVAPESTLDVSTGRMGIPGAIATDEVLAAARNSDNAQAAMTDYLRNRFYATAFRDGELKPDAARKFMLDNAELMDRFPSLKQGFQAAADGVDGADATIATMQQRAAQLRDPRISTAAAFLKANPYEEIRALERQRNPRSSAAQLVRQARKDESGEALAGVKAALVDELMTRGRTSAFDDMGNPVLSGRAVEKALADRKFGGIAREVLSPEEMERTRRIIQELRKVETMQSAKPVSGGRLLDDAPSNILSFIVRTLGARQGAKLGAGTSGASMLTANFASRRAQALLESLTNDRAEAMLRRAIAGDRELYMSLLLPPSALTKKHESRLIETMIGLGANEIGGEDNAPQQ
jgi:phage shock protein A